MMLKKVLLLLKRSLLWKAATSTTFHPSHRYDLSNPITYHDTHASFSYPMDLESTASKLFSHLPFSSSGQGGIGSTVLLYLASSGVGHVTIVDYDTVEMSNLHRQIIHRDEDASKDWKDVGMNKAQSAKRAMLKLNPTISVTALEIMIDASNAMELVSKHDVVVDACDNPRTRYLLNDACVLAGKTLVSGSAMGTEGQLTVYNYHNHVDNSDRVETKATACYRCLYPNPNPVEGCKSCSDNGVLGPVPGLIGVLQAVEVIKVLTGIG